MNNGTLVGWTSAQWAPNQFPSIAKDTSGKVTTWVFEGASPIAVKRTGTVRADFTANIGKTVTVRGVPGRDGTMKGAAETIKLSDGREVVVGGQSGDGRLLSNDERRASLLLLPRRHARSAAAGSD